MNSIKKVPCEDCICVPICKHKSYLDLFFQCSIAMFYSPINNPKRMQYLYAMSKTLNSTQWRIDQHTDGYHLWTK